MKPNGIKMSQVYCSLLLVLLASLSISCSAPRGGFKVGKFQLSGKETRQVVMERYGMPMSETTEGSSNQYRTLTYPIEGETERLLVLFHNDDFLAAARESSRSIINRTLRSHARHHGGKVILYSSWRNGTNSIYVTTRERLARVPQWTPRQKIPAPLSQSQAESIAREWLHKSETRAISQPTVQQVFECRSVPGVSFYVVNLGASQKIVVLMDGTVVTGELDSDE